MDFPQKAVCGVFELPLLKKPKKHKNAVKKVNILNFKKERYLPALFSA
jgi:hypothetical protein